MKLSRFELPPGPSFILQQLFSPKFLGYGALVGFTRFAARRLDVDLPLWLIFSSSVMALPAILYAQSEYKYWRDKRKAESLGARLAPIVPYRWPAGIDLITAVVRALKFGYPYDVVGDWLVEGGQTVDMRCLWESDIVTTEPQYVKMILSTHFDRYDKGDAFRAACKSLFGTGIFLSDGDLWKFHRSMTRPFFSKDRISDFELFDDHAERAIAKMKERFKEGTAVDIQDVFSRFTLDTATVFLFGKDVETLSGDLPYPSTHKKPTARTHPSDRFALAVNQAQVDTFQRTWYGELWKLVDFWEDIVETNKRIAFELIDPLIQAALEKKKAANGTVTVDDKEGSTLLDDLVRQTDDFEFIRDETFDVMIAGRDTTASLATFAITMLAEHPSIFARLRSEVLETLGPHGKVNSENLREMKYLRAVLNETLRLYTTVPGNTRSSKNGDLWPGLDGGKPIYIPPHTVVGYIPWFMHRRTELWGPTALEFDPDRFLDDRAKKYLSPNPFIFVPFGAGPRICLGQQFAYNEASTIIAKIAQSFKSITLDMDSNPEAKPPISWATAGGRQATEKVWVKTHITLYAKGGVWVKMEDVDTE